MQKTRNDEASWRAGFVDNECADLRVNLNNLTEIHELKDTFTSNFEQAQSDDIARSIEALAVLDSDRALAGDDVVECSLRDFVGEVVLLFANGIPDQGPGGFWLHGRLVGDKRRILDGTPLPPVVEGFYRWRLPGVDGVARPRDRNAPSIVLSEATGALLLIRRDNLRPLRLDGVAELVKVLEGGRQ